MYSPYLGNYHLTLAFKSDLVFLDVIIRINMHENVQNPLEPHLWGNIGT